MAVTAPPVFPGHFWPSFWCTFSYFLNFRTPKKRKTALETAIHEISPEWGRHRGRHFFLRNLLMQKNGITIVIWPRFEAHETEQITEKRPLIRSEIWRFSLNFGVLKRKNNGKFVLRSGARDSGLKQGAARKRRHLHLIVLMRKNG